MTLRPANSSDLDFIYSSWLGSYRFGPLSAAREIRKEGKTVMVSPLLSEVYYKNHRKLITKILNLSQIVIACNPEDHSKIYGWSVGRDIQDMSILSYVYVKRPYRGKGVGSRLIEPFTRRDCFCTHMRKNLSKKSLELDLMYNPYLDLCL